MRRVIPATIFILAVVLCGCASAGKTLSSGKGILRYELTNNGVKITSSAAGMDIEVWKGDVLKVIWRKKGVQEEAKTFVTSPEPPPFEVSEGDDIVSLRTDKLTVEINMESGAVTYYDRHKDLLLAEGGRFVEEIPGDSGKFSVRQEFMFRPWEGLYGLEADDKTGPDFNGATEFVINKDVKFPLLASTAGYGIIWPGDNNAKFSGKPGDSYFSTDNADGITYYFVYGGTSGSAAAAASLITGKPGAPGKAETSEAAAKATGSSDTLSKLSGRLYPYVNSSLWEATANGIPFIQPAALVYTGGLKPHTAQYQYMAGRSIMVCPQAPGIAGAELPSGSVWYDFWTGIALDGGGPVKVKNDRSKTPIFIPAGSIIPMSSGDKGLEIRVYPGQDAEFTLHYGAEGNSEIRLSWEQKAKTLTIGQLKGPDVNGVKGMKMRVVFVHKGHGAGDKEEAKPDSVKDYNGEIMFVRMD